MNRLLRIILFCCTLFLGGAVYAQDVPKDVPEMPKDTSKLNAAISMDVEVGKAFYKGDSIPHVIMPTVYKYPPMEFKSPQERERYNRLVANVKYLLPYAKTVRIIIVETYDYVQTLPKEERQAHIDKVEENLKKEYKPVIEKLTRSQGRLLVKLIDRECNQTGYQIAKAFIGSLRANVSLVSTSINTTTPRGTTVSLSEWLEWWKATRFNIARYTPKSSKLST